MPKHPLAANATLTPEDTDDVVQLGRLLKAAMEYEDDVSTMRISSEWNGAKTGATYAEASGYHAYDNVRSIRTMIGSTKANSLSGAAIQIVEAMDIVDRIFELIPGNEETFELKHLGRTLSRLLFSALEVVDGAAEYKVADVVSKAFVGRHLSPWLTPREKLAIIRSE